MVTYIDKFGIEQTHPIGKPIDNGHVLVTEAMARKINNNKPLPRPGCFTESIYQGIRYCVGRTDYRGKTHWCVFGMRPL